MIAPTSRKVLLFLTATAAGCVALPHRSPAPLTYTPGEGTTYALPGQEAIPNAKDAQAQFDHAFGAETKGDINTAIAGYAKTVHRFPHTTLAATAQFRMGQLLEKQGKLDAAFKAYEKLVKDYPTSTDFDKALEGEFRLGTAYLEGARQRVLGVPTLPSMGQSVMMFSSIIKNAPYSRFAPLAQFSIGRAKEKDNDLKGAVEAYQTVVDKYPTNPLAADALYQIGFVWMKVSQSGSNDRKARVLARESFEDFLAAYPNNEKAAQARDDLASLGTGETGGSMRIAKYYDQHKQYKAAIVYYNDVIRENPNSKESEQAKARLAALRAKYGEAVVAQILNPAATGPNGGAVGDNRVQASTDTARRPDYNGPAVSAPPAAAAPAASGGPSGSGAGTGAGTSGGTTPPAPLPLPVPIPEGEQPMLPTPGPGGEGTPPPSLNLTPGPAGGPATAPAPAAPAPAPETTPAPSATP